jgi:fructose-1,6-bisphosphatase/sedoheptulose 1,7-bisphosphatase-like protein
MDEDVRVGDLFVLVEDKGNDKDVVTYLRSIGRRIILVTDTDLLMPILGTFEAVKCLTEHGQVLPLPVSTVREYYVKVSSHA